MGFDIVLGNVASNIHLSAICIYFHFIRAIIREFDTPSKIKGEFLRAEPCPAPCEMQEPGMLQPQKLHLHIKGWNSREAPALLGLLGDEIHSPEFHSNDIHTAILLRMLQ